MARKKVRAKGANVRAKAKGTTKAKAKAKPKAKPKTRTKASSAKRNRLKKVSPVLMVDAVEPCIPFWERLGFKKTAEVPEGDKLGFVILEKDGLEVMYQSKASVQGDVPALAASPMGGTFLFMEVTDLDAVIAQLGGAPPVFARRKTFYGMDEIAVREPGGNAITFAMPVAG
jgi:hypothetical protein